MDYSSYEPHIDFIYTTLLMIWGGSCIGIGLVAVPYIFEHLPSSTEASELTSRIFKKQDSLVRVIAILMIVLFYFKSKLTYSYQHIEWTAYVVVIHCFIFSRIVSKKLWKLRDSISTFDTPKKNDPIRVQFNKWHTLVKILYAGQIIGVVGLLYLHAFGL